MTQIGDSNNIATLNIMALVKTFYVITYISC